MDLCKATDLQPLADLDLKIRTTDRTPPMDAPGEACLFEFNTASSPSSLRVEAVTAADVAGAQRVYRGQAGGNMQPDSSVTGLGDEAEAFTLETEPQAGFKYSQYRIHARSGNLVIQVWLAVGGKAFTPKETMAQKVTAIAKATLALAMQEWKVR